MLVILSIQGKGLHPIRSCLPLSSRSSQEPALLWWNQHRGAIVDCYMAVMKFTQICEESFRFINMSKHTTGYLTVNIRLVFLKILDDIRNERLLGSLG